MKFICFPLFIFLLMLSSCSSIRHLSLGTAAPMFTQAAPGFEKEGNWQAFKDGIPGNLKLLEGLIEVKPEDEHLLSAAIKGNAGYAYAVYETLYLEDKLKENDDSFYKTQAIAYYNKAIQFGLAFLKSKDIQFNNLQLLAKKNKGISQLFDESLDDDLVSLEAVAFTAQAMGSLINLQRDNMVLLAQLSIVKGMFDWVCKTDPNIGNGVCAIFYASYEAGRPRMLGGNPEKGKELFEKAIEMNPHNWLTRVAYLEHYIIPMSDEMLYQQQKIELKKYKELHERQNNWSPTKSTNPAFNNKRLRLYQAVAIKRFETIQRFEKDLF